MESFTEPYILKFGEPVSRYNPSIRTWEMVTEKKVTFAGHPELAQYKPVYMGGELILRISKVRNKKIYEALKVDNGSGHYIPAGEHLEPLIKRRLKREGIVMTDGVYKEYPGTKIAPLIKEEAVLTIKPGISVMSGLGLTFFPPGNASNFDEIPESNKTKSIENIANGDSENSTFLSDKMGTTYASEADSSSSSECLVRLGLFSSSSNSDDSFDSMEEHSSSSEGCIKPNVSSNN
jgi:hypothetical protein